MLGFASLLASATRQIEASFIRKAVSVEYQRNDSVRATDVSIDGPSGILAVNGRLIVAEFFGGRLLEIDATTNTMRPVLDKAAGCANELLLQHPTNIGLLKRDEYVVLESLSAQINRIALKGCLSQPILSTRMTEFGLKIEPPLALAVAQDGSIYFTDWGHRLLRLSNRTLTVVLDKSAGLRFPQGLALDREGNILIADTENHRVCRVRRDDAKFETIAGSGVAGSGGDGEQAIRAQLRFPSALTVGSTGEIFVGGSGRVRMIHASDGRISTVAGTGTLIHAGDNEAATRASFMSVAALAVDGRQLYITDMDANRVRSVDLRSGKITTVAGNGLPVRRKGHA